MRVICPICEEELKIKEENAKNVLHAYCLDCDKLIVINIHGIFHSSYVSQPSEWEKEIKNLARHFL